VTESLPPEDPRDALIREQAALIAGLSAQVTDLSAQLAELTGLVRELRGQLGRRGRPHRGTRGTPRCRRRCRARLYDMDVGDV
jgi:hypothetical protein